VNYIRAQASVIGGSIDGILETAATTVPGAGENDPDLFYIRPKWLGLAIERFLYGDLGLACDVQIPARSTRVLIGRKQLPVVDSSALITVTLGSVYLPNVKDDTLWDLVLKNTFSTGNADYSQPDGPATFKAAAKLIVGRHGPRADTFSRASGAPWKFSRATAESIAGAARSIRLVRAAPNWPEPSNYANPDPQAPGEVGMRVGDYNKWGHVSNAPEREAHHITQFLLPEYLNNSATRLPFVPELVAKGLYPGVKKDGAHVDAIQNSSGASIEVKRAFNDHGGIMATVFLARYTHQSPIHYRRSAPDEKDGHSSMSATLDSVFRGALAAALPGVPGDVFSRDRSKAAPMLKLLASAATDDFPVAELNNTTRNRVKDAVFKASRTAYVDMKKDMSPKLMRAIFELEPAYYSAVDLQSRKLEKFDLDRVFAAATNGNKAFAKSVGFE
jgi:hypothetical protein